MTADWEFYEYHRRSAEEKYEKLNNCHYLLGKYGYHAEQGEGDPKLAEMVAELKAVLDGTWKQPEPPTE